MLPRLLFTILIVSTGLSAETSKLKGRVVLNEIGGAPVTNVTVGAVAGAGPTATGSLGLFTLEFPAKRPGETVQLVIHKEGFEVVNDVQLEVALPIDPDAKPVIILLCKIGNREEMARRFYRLKSVEAIEESYRRKTEKANSDEMAQLRRKRDQSLSAAGNAAEELAKTSPGQASELYRTAMRLFLDGKTDEALKVLDEEKLRDLARSAKETQAEAEKEIEKASQAWLLKAQLFTMQFQFNEAEKAYEGAVEASPDSYAANLALAYFNQGLNRYREARKAYGHCLELARRSGKDADLATTLNNLGVLDLEQNQTEKARKELEEALKISRELAQKNPEAHLYDVAKTLNNLGILDANQNRTA